MDEQEVNTSNEAVSMVEAENDPINLVIYAMRCNNNTEVVRMLRDSGMSLKEAKVLIKKAKQRIAKNIKRIQGPRPHFVNIDKDNSKIQFYNTRVNRKAMRKAMQCKHTGIEIWEAIEEDDNDESYYRAICWSCWQLSKWAKPCHHRKKIKCRTCGSVRTCVIKCGCKNVMTKIDTLRWRGKYIKMRVTFVRPKTQRSLRRK